MTRREHKYLKGDRLMSFMGGEPFPVPAHHWRLRLKVCKMTSFQYIVWKRQYPAGRLNRSLQPQPFMVKPPLTLNYDYLVECATKRYSALSPEDAITKLLSDFESSSLSIIAIPTSYSQ